MGYLRSNYVASIATDSGGIGPVADTTMRDPTNRGPVFITYADGSTAEEATERWFCEDFCAEALDEGTVQACRFEPL